MTALNTLNADSGTGFQPIWPHIEPLLEQAMDSLDDTDRSAILLRYFENKSLREVGQALGTSDDAAQKRVSRPVDRLREFFTKRGVTVGASGFVLVISANAVQAAPAGLAQSVSLAAIAKAAVATVSTLSLMNGALTLIASKPLKCGLIALLLALLTSVTIVTGLKMFRAMAAPSSPN